MADPVSELVSDEFQTADPATTVDEAIDLFRDRTPTDGTTLYYLYVVDGDELSGVVSLNDLLNADQTASVGEIMTTDIRTVSTDTPVADAADIVSERGFPALPVTDGSKIVGVVRTGDLIEAVEDEGTMSALRKAGFWV
ncbi:CBS domain-containing protein [Natronococcus sp. A-GB1]|uniref:CBS domain-containing protein n=1 Tax=Natronococcus sp. A-GB1 TaxID=3037648 RepID=UPI00241F44F7|nr:CBS domain-containing protein [Natronococcus sp. A-GB1]MDG5758836.1 CBS domain-containing protein [Natronococcus sp. A-GB1]